MHLAVVESPAKARTIRPWLGREYNVRACYGHVLELPAKTGAVDPDDDFAMAWAEAGKRAARALQAIAAALERADGLILATEPDREGEAIAWEVLTWLSERDAIGEMPVHRVVFHEVTQDAVREAMTRPRAMDMDLVNAERARQVLDHLAGYGLSRVLWRQLKGRGSPGRLQSVALRLICARESEIEASAPLDRWTVDAALAGRAGSRFAARLSRLDGVRLDRLALDTEAAAQRAAERVRTGEFHVEGLAHSTVERTPRPPSPRRRCCRRPGARWASGCARPCGSPGRSTRGSISAAAASASSPSCAPAARRCRRRRQGRRAGLCSDDSGRNTWPGSRRRSPHPPALRGKRRTRSGRWNSGVRRKPWRGGSTPTRRSSTR